MAVSFPLVVVTTPAAFAFSVSVRAYPVAVPATQTASFILTSEKFSALYALFSLTFAVVPLPVHIIRVSPFASPNTPAEARALSLWILPVLVAVSEVSVHEPTFVPFTSSQD